MTADLMVFWAHPLNSCVYPVFEHEDRSLSSKFIDSFIAALVDTPPLTCMQCTACMRCGAMHEYQCQGTVR